MPKSYADAIKQGKFEKSVYKFFLSFMVLADHDVAIRIGDSTYEFPKREIRISERFWRADGCYRTGKCCSKVSMDLFMSSEEFTKLQALYPDSLKPWQSVMMQVQNKGEAPMTVGHTIWTSVGGDKCPYLITDTGEERTYKPDIPMAGCGIHELNPIHCALPHLYFDLRNGSKPIDQQYINITKRQFGRNWAFGCPVTFIPYNEFARRRDLLLLNRCRDLLLEFTGSAERVSDIITRIEERPLLTDGIIPVTEVS